MTLEKSLADWEKRYSVDLGEKMITIRYINLDSAIDRRKTVEENFSKFATSSFRLKRIPAIDAEIASRQSFGAHLKPTEKACILSHKKAIEDSLNDDGASIIMEDDALFGPIGFTLLEDVAANTSADTDLILTNTLIANTDLLIQQYVMYRKTLATKKIGFYDMKGIQSAGSDSYIISQAAKSKLSRLLDDMGSLDEPYDLLLKSWIQRERIRAKFVFPFLSYLSPAADASLITRPNEDWNQFRRLLSIDHPQSIENLMNSGLTTDAAIEHFTDAYLRFVKRYLIHYMRY